MLVKTRNDEHLRVGIKDFDGVEFPSGIINRIENQVPVIFVVYLMNRIIKCHVKIALQINIHKLKQKLIIIDILRITKDFNRYL